MDEILKKIDEMFERIPDENDPEIARFYYVAGCRETLESVKKIILSEQKEPLTIGDKMRESNESLAEYILNLPTCESCTCHYYENDLIYCNREKDCINGILDYLNQPSTDSQQYKN